MSPEAAPGIVEQPQIDGGPTAHPELDVEEVRHLAVRGVGAMLLRSIGQRGLQMVGNILLARWLAPRTFGFYAIVSFVVGIAGFLSDLGLGASLVQRAEKLTERDLRTAFSLSLCLNLAAVGILWGVAGPLVRAYGIDAANVTAVRVLALTILFSTFTTIPSITLERGLKFRRLAVADLVGSLVYVGIAVPLAFGYRAPSVAEAGAAGAVWVFVWATVASRATFTVLVYTLAPWRPRLGVDARAMRAMLRFGLPYQLNGFVNALKDNFIPTFVAFAVTAEAVGLVTWAVGLATNALFLLPIVSRVTFPAFARLQHDHDALRDAIEKAIRWCAATVFPATLFLAALARQIVEHVYGPKWEPGLPSFYLLCIPMLNAAYSTVMVSALYSLGRAKVVLRLTVIWALAGWALAVPATLAFGMHGFALAMSAVSLLAVLSARELNKVVRVDFVRPLARMFVLAAIPAGAVALVAHQVRNSGQLALLALAGGLAYLVGLALAGELRELRAYVRSARARPAVATAVARVPAEVPEHA